MRKSYSMTEPPISLIVEADFHEVLLAFIILSGIKPRKFQLEQQKKNFIFWQ